MIPEQGRRGRVEFNRSLAGWLEEEAGGICFRYDASWLEREDAQPISLTLPLRGAAFDWTEASPFFLGLLPEGWLFNLALSSLRLSTDDPFGLLLALCRDCIGAVSVVPVYEEHA